MKYWLMKSEPETYSIEDLEKDNISDWEGVRNYQARNFMRDSMSEGDLAFFYHSNANPSGIAGICRVVKTGIPDDTAWDPNSHYFDPKSDPNNPRWIMVQIEFVKKFPKIISLSELRSHKKLQGLSVLKKGQRLSVMPIEEFEFIYINSLV